MFVQYVCVYKEFNFCQLVTPLIVDILRQTQLNRNTMRKENCSMIEKKTHLPVVLLCFLMTRTVSVVISLEYQVTGCRTSLDLHCLKCKLEATMSHYQKLTTCSLLTSLGFLTYSQPRVFPHTNSHYSIVHYILIWYAL